MSDAIGEIAGARPGLAGGLRAWVERGDARPLLGWLDRTLDAEGVPRALPVPDWLPCLTAIADARERRPGEWPDAVDARIEGFFRTLLRFSRPDGTPAMGPGVVSPEIGPLFRSWVRRFPDAGLETVVRWWFPSRARRRAHAAPPLPAWSWGARPLAALRANWSAEGDFLTVDHRIRGASCAFELRGLGRTWLGPEWTLQAPGGAAAPARANCWHSDSSADLLEWTFRVGDSPVVRSAALLRGRQIAVLADQIEAPDTTAELRMRLHDGVATEPIAESRALGLLARRARARVFPLGIPRRPDGSERGTLVVDDATLALRQPAEERRRIWLPLVVSWAPERNRREAHWRTLTVSEKSRPCSPDVAFAARLSWGRHETLVVYRSLGRPALRAFLGHQTRARYLIGLFTSEGQVEPIVQIDE